MGNSISIPEPVIEKVATETVPSMTEEELKRSLDDNPQDALANLWKLTLERDDTGDFRVYRDKEGNVYHSVTHILQETSSQGEKAALAKWLKRPGSAAKGEMARQIGTLAHENLEYVFKTARTLCSNAGNKRNSWKIYADGLARPTKAITAWALKTAIQGAPTPSWASSGYARGLASFIESSITAIHAVEFYIHYTPKDAIHDGTKNAIHGVAGTCDCLVDVQGDGPFVLDWKTSKNERSEAMYEQFYDQCGAYASGLTHLTGIKPKGAFVVVARRTGSPAVKFLDQFKLMDHQARFDKRFNVYMDRLKEAA